MFIVTNRELETRERGLEQFGERPNRRGPHELRIAEVTRERGNWKVSILPDRLGREMKAEVGLPLSKPAFASEYAAAKVFERVQARNRNLLFFVHGFNNDVESVVTRAEGFEKSYGVEVVAFTWPANGGGVAGVVSYKSDKRDARASVGALHRVLEKSRQFLDAFNRERIAKVVAEANERFPSNPERRQDFITRMCERDCPFSVNLVLHSMGNYLFKQVLGSSIYEGNRLLFDNVIMVAADTNNEGHERWVDRIHCRKRVYVTLNEDDAALRASRIKSGEEQLARLGHYPYNLVSRQAVYVDFTGAPQVGGSHAYFEGDPIEDRDGHVFRFFKGAFNGERVESLFQYDAANNLYRIP